MYKAAHSTYFAYLNSWRVQLLTKKLTIDPHTVMLSKQLVCLNAGNAYQYHKPTTFATMFSLVCCNVGGELTSQYCICTSLWLSMALHMFGLPKCWLI